MCHIFSREQGEKQKKRESKKQKILMASKDKLDFRNEIAVPIKKK